MEGDFLPALARELHRVGRILLVPDLVALPLIRPAVRDEAGRHIELIGALIEGVGVLPELRNTRRR